MTYRNLAAEMARKGISKKEIAKSLNMRYQTFLDKTSGKSRLYLDEAFKIKEKFFPECKVEYLFETDDSNKIA